MSPAHLAQENHRVSELSLADGADGARLCALLSRGSDPVILLEEEGEGETSSHEPSWEAVWGVRKGCCGLAPGA